MLYGTVIYFDVKIQTYKPGQEPPSPTQDKKDAKKGSIVDMKPKDPTDPKRTKTVSDEIIVIEEEYKMPFE